MAEAKTLSPYEQAMEALFALGRERKPFDSTGNRFYLFSDYIKILELEEAISHMKVIHVAGTKGKGSTCTFTESILRNCGFKTGLFVKPHLIHFRECYRLNGVEISEEKFLSYFWWCYDRLKENVTESVPMPDFSRLRPLLALKIFAAEQVDVAILESGMGGRFCATNVFPNPVVCGLTSLGYDHMEILGKTIGEIAWHKAGILKRGVPAFTVSQYDEAMHVLQEEASKLDVPLRVAPPLDASSLNGLKFRLQGEHQYINAGLAVALSSTWLQRTGHLEINYLNQTGPLPEQFIKGLTVAYLQGRAQIFPDRYINPESPGDLVFYLDGAHTPESMEVCARWFSAAIKGDNQQETLNFHQPLGCHEGRSSKKSEQILLFNCMSVRDPQLLLPRLVKTCASYGVHFKKALFVPYMQKPGFHILLPTEANQVGLSRQFTLQRAWENLIQGNKGGEVRNADIDYEDMKDDTDLIARSCQNSMVFSSLPLAIKWLRDSVQQNQSLCFQVLVTGSFHLVGDVMKLVKCEGS